MTTDFKAMQQRAKRPERTVPICLAGDLIAEFEELERQLEQAERTASDSLEGAGTGSIVEQMEALQERMRDDTYPFRLRALPRPTFKALLVEHPPRKDDETGDVVDADKYINFNADTFYSALIRASVIDPVLDEDGWSKLLDEDLTDAQFDTLATAGWVLNRGAVDVPFSHAASRIRRSTEPE